MKARVTVGLVALLAAGCAGKSEGEEGGACYGNGTCNSGLVCLSSLCVRPGGADASTAGAADASTTVPPGPDAGGGGGSVSYSVSCEADGCGRTGTLRITVKECGASGATVASAERRGTSLAAGTPVTGQLAQIAPGAYCLSAFLDVDDSSTRSTGDVVGSSDESPVQVVAGQDASAQLMLGMVVQ